MLLFSFCYVTKQLPASLNSLYKYVGTRPGYPNARAITSKHKLEIPNGSQSFKQSIVYKVPKLWNEVATSLFYWNQKHITT